MIFKSDEVISNKSYPSSGNVQKVFKISAQWLLPFKNTIPLLSFFIIKSKSLFLDVPYEASVINLSNGRIWVPEPIKINVSFASFKVFSRQSYLYLPY